jgi:heme/copper-type cytochrome/quinol oxidase subunit 1
MASGFMNMFHTGSFFLSSVIMFISLFIKTGPAGGGWVVYPPLSALGTSYSWFWFGYDLVVDCNDILYCIISSWGDQLHHHCNQP